MKLDTLPTVTVSREVATLADRARDYAKASLSANTTAAYAKAWDHFAGWCASQGLQAMPAEPSTLALYLTAHADSLKVSTLRQRVAAIGKLHRAKGHTAPGASESVRAVMKGIARTKGTAPAKKTALVTEDLRRVLQALPDSLIGKRDRALLLFGFAGAFRRSELAALQADDIEATRDGLVVTLRRSKTDQEGKARQVGIPYGSHPLSCPVRAWQDWQEAAGIAEGLAFRSVNRHGHIGSSMSDKSVALVVKARTAAVGLDAAKYAGHSLRRGFATSATRNGASDRAAMRQGGWKSSQVFGGYVEEGTIFVDNAASALGL